MALTMGALVVGLASGIAAGDVTASYEKGSAASWAMVLVLSIFV